MNLLFRSPESKNHFIEDILENLKKRNLINKCTVIIPYVDNFGDISKEFCRVINASKCFISDYEALCEWTKIPSVPTYIWEELKPYKSTIFNLMSRMYGGAHILTYEEMDRIYNRNVLFWNYILDLDDIGMCFFSVIPHTVWEYTIYALAKVKKIPTLLISISSIAGLYEVGTSLDKWGINVLKYFNNPNNDFEMDKEAIPLYDRLTSSNRVVDLSSRKKRIENRENRIRFLSHIPKKEIIKNYLYYEKLKRTNVPYDKHLYEYKCRHSIDRYFHIWNMKTIEYYDKYITTDFNINEKYILYLMQFVPEANTLPQAGELSNQLRTIQMLAEGAAKAGVKLVVKEHWEQLKREKDFYDDLKDIPNVICVNTEFDTSMLVDNAIAVCSQTGSFLVEGLVTNKHRLVTVRVGLSYAPGAFFVESSDDVARAINDIRSGIEVSEEDCKRYYISMYKSCVWGKLDWDEPSLTDINSMKEEYTDLISSFVESGMRDDFIYVKKKYR